MKFLIIGGDAAGMSAASRAKRNDPDMDVTVLEKTADVSYSACGMPYNIADPARDINDLVVRKAEVFRQKQGIHLLTGHLATAIDRAAKIVRGVDTQGQAFEHAYDQLLIATGASAVRPDIPGAGLPGVLTLKSLNDGRKIKAYLASANVKTVVILGMGFIALEMCEALRARNINVIMTKPGQTFLPWLNSELSAIVRQTVEAGGVQLCMGDAVERIERANPLRVVCGAHSFEADMVLAGIGVTPNSGLAADAGLALGPQKAVSVNHRMQTSDETIYAAGDCADAFHLVTGQKTWIPLALRANRGGWAVADNVCGRNVELPGITGTSVFKVLDLQVARTGLNVQEATDAGFSPVEVVITSRSRAHAHPGSTDIRVQMVGDQTTGRLLGVQMVGKEGVAHRINAPAVALFNRMTVADFVQTDLAYAPPFGPVWDPMLTAANQLLKDL
ncbi:MAG: FAD-dependent oxidoreductase [Desulfosalsimonadaceae bacterium]